MSRKSAGTILVMLAATVAVSVPAAQAQSITWLHQFGTALPDYGLSVATTPGGGALVARQTALLPNGPPGTPGVYVHAFGQSGVASWIHFIPAIFGYVATAPDGNSYVAGMTAQSLSGQLHAGFQDAYLRKLDPSGNELWTRMYGTSGADAALGVALDAAGNVYLAGPSDSNSWIRSYDGAGNLLWHSSIPRAGIAIQELSSDPAGNTVVVGSVLTGSGGSNQNAFATRFSPAGVQQWFRSFGTSLNDTALGVWSDIGGNAYVAWNRFGPMETLSVGSLRKLGPDGSLAWDRPVVGLGFVRAWDVVDDGAGAVFVAGSVSIGSAPADVFLAGFSTDGIQAGTFTIEAPMGAEAYSIAAKGSDALYLSGAVEGAFPGEASSGNSDAFAARLSRTTCDDVPGATATEEGIISQPVHTAVEPVTGPLGPTVHTVNCTLIAPLGL